VNQYRNGREGKNAGQGIPSSTLQHRPIAGHRFELSFHCEENLSRFTTLMDNVGAFTLARNF
jgi:hypothetical protein